MTDHVWIHGKRHQIVDLATFDRLVWPECVIDLPATEAGWATTRVGSARFATWLEWDRVTA